jgi:hypothetical protein
MVYVSANNAPVVGVRIENVDRVRYDQHTHPAAFDPRGRVAPPVNQGACGSCWAIAAAQCVQDRYAKAGQDVPPLSYQHMNDCSRNCVYYNGRKGCSVDCRGGFLVAAFEFLKQHGVYEASVYGGKFDSARGETHVDNAELSAQCTVPPKALGTKRWRIAGYYLVTVNPRMFGIPNARETLPRPLSAEEHKSNADNICEDIWRNGTVAACMNMFSDFAPYALDEHDVNSVYRLGWQGSEPIHDQTGSVHWSADDRGPGGLHFVTGHAVCIIGWGSTPNGTLYWIVRNSWGKRGAYVRVLRRANCSAIESDVEGVRVIGNELHSARSAPQQEGIAAATAAARDTVATVAAALVASAVCAAVVIASVRRGKQQRL